MQSAVNKNPRAQTAATLEKGLRARSNRLIHPVTRPAFCRTVKPHPLDFKILADQFIKIDVTRHHVATHERRRTILNFKRAAKLIENLEREKCDLAFVIFLVIEEAIAANAVTGHAFDRRNFNRRMIVRFAPMVAEKLWPREM